MAMIARDTSARVAALQSEFHRRLNPGERLLMAMEMSEFARSLTRAGLRDRHPEYDEAQLDAEMLKVLYGFSVGKK
jgi:hypothetical protein